MSRGCATVRRRLVSAVESSGSGEEGMYAPQGFLQKTRVQGLGFRVHPKPSALVQLVRV